MRGVSNKHCLLTFFIEPGTYCFMSKEALARLHILIENKSGKVDGLITVEVKVLILTRNV